MVRVILRSDRERPVLQRHPWVFSGAIGTLHGQPGSGDVVDVYAANGEWLARGTWSSSSQIRVRLFTWNHDEPLDDDLLRRRLERAIAGRTFLMCTPRHSDADAADAPACRLVYAESDGLPGLIVDRYGAYLVIQVLIPGMAVRAERIIALLAELVRPRGIYERSDVEVRQKEDLPATEGVRWGEAPPERLIFRSADRLPWRQSAPMARFFADIRSGQKTGFYLDQTANRQRVAAYCNGKQVLDCFCYTGGFTVHAAQAGALHVTAIDSSTQALAVLQEHIALNEISTAIEPVAGDIFKLLRQYRDDGRLFDVVILDPPKFAHNRAQIERATRGYKDINMLAMQLLRPEGILATFSCSGLVSSDLFQKVVFGAALDAGRDVQILERLAQAPDHPVLVSFPEGEYLKGVICRVC